MIKTIKGCVTAIADKKIVFSLAQGLFELEIMIPNVSLIELNKEYSLEVAMVFSSDNGYSMYGFLTDIEKQYFLLFQDCRGIGARLAIAILDKYSLDSLYEAIRDKNSNLFSSISGIGQKKAEALILELQSKIKKIPIPSIKESVSLLNTNLSDLEAALLSLGYAKKEVERMIKKVYSKENGIQKSLIDLIRQAVE